MSFDQIFNQLFDNQGDSNSLATGIRSLDKLIDGGFCDELVLISGRPNHGKSMLLLNMMLNFSYFQEYKGMLVAPRINQKSLTRRLVAIMEDSGAPLEQWEEGVMLDRLSDVKRLLQQKVLVDYHFENIEVILTKAIEWKASYLIIDDFFSIVQNAFFSVKQYMELIQRLNDFVKEAKIPVFISIIAGTSAENRGGGQIPFLRDIYRSDLLLPLIHKVVLLYREAEVGITESVGGGSTENNLELMLAMNALGRTGSLALNFKRSGRIEG